MLTALSEQQKQNIKDYEYNGGDSSLTYKYLLSPFAASCVDHFVPPYVAPNVITLSGLVITFLCCLLTTLYNPKLHNCPRWLCFLTGLAIVAYQTLDNMDGKQARKTKSSNALGMLFDHSCDVINTVVIGLLMASVLGTGWNLKAYICMLSGYIPFYIQTWEEYHLGYMVLPLFNGPSEGLLIAAAICFVSGCWGPQWWQQPNEHLRFLNTIATPFDIIILVAVVLTVSTAVYQIKRVLKFCESLKSDGKVCITQLLPFSVYCLSTVVWLTLSDLSFTKYPLLSFLLTGSLFAELAFKNLYVHIVREEFGTAHRYTAWSSVLLPTAALWSPHIEAPIFFALLTLSLFLVGFNMFTAFTSFADTLNIHIFLLGERHYHAKE